MWVRGLKHRVTVGLCMGIDVAPYVGAWIETSPPFGRRRSRLSHPMWVRGLKLQSSNDCCVLRYVAPYVGAWIETEN